MRSEFELWLMKDLLDKNKDDAAVHPREIILWKYAMYLVQKQKWKAGFEAYKKMIELCAEETDLTIYVIGLAAELERYAAALKNGMKERGQFKKSLQKKYLKLKEKELPDSMLNLFGEIDFGKEDWEYYYGLSRRVAY